MKDIETVDQFMTRVYGIVTQFQTYGEALEKKGIVEKVLRCLTKKFSMVVTAIEESKDLSTFTLEELTGSLLSHEARLSQEDKSLSHAFSTQTFFNRVQGRGGRGRGRREKSSNSTDDRTAHEHHEHTDHCEHIHNPQNQRGRGGKRWTNRSNVQCNYCKKYGHYECDYKKKQADQNSGRANVSNVEEDLSEVMFLSYQATEAELQSDVWLLDSGCNNHMTGNKSLFSDLDPSINSKIKLGDHYLVPAQGKGTVPILTK